MLKKIFLFLLMMTLLMPSTSSVLVSAESEKATSDLDYEKFLNDSRVRTLIDMDFDKKDDYFENVTKSKDRQAYIDEKHGISYSYPGNGASIGYKKLSAPESKGIIFINFDFMRDEPGLFYVRLLNSKWKANTAADDPNMTETFAASSTGAGFYTNSTGWSVNAKKKVELHKWMNVTMWLDLDVGQIYYAFDNEYIGETSSKSSELSDFCGILFSQSSATSKVYIDNIKVAAIDRTYFDELSENGVTVPEKLMEKVTISAQIGNLGNAVYEKDKEIPAKISVFNKLSISQNLVIKTKAKTREGVDIVTNEFEKEVNPESTTEVNFNLPGMNKYGYSDLYIEIYSKEDNRLIAKDVYEYALVNIVPEGLRNQKVGVIDHARPANARMGDPVINATFASKAGFATTRSEHDWSEYEGEKGVYRLSDMYKRLFEYKRSQNMGHLDILVYGNSLYGKDSPPSTPQSIEGYKNYAVAITGDLLKEVGGNELELELWNEYNNYGSWFNHDNQPASMYYELIKETYPAVKEKYPSVRMWGMSTIGVDSNWIKQVLDLGGGEYMDGISIHPYTFTLMPDIGDAINKTLKLKEIIKEYGYDDKTMPLRATEWGWPSAGVNGYLNEAEQASAFIRMMVLNDRYDLFEQVDWYTINDGGDQPEQEQSFGLIRFMNGKIPYGVKPSYLTACNYNKLMTNSVYEKNVQIGDDVQSYKYKLRDGRDCVVAWVKDPNGAETVSVDLGTESAILMDAYGNEQEIHSQNGVFTVAYTQMPQYLIGNFNKLERAEKIFGLNTQTLNIPIGESAEVQLYQFKGDKVRIEAEENSDVKVAEMSGFDGDVALIGFENICEGSGKDSVTIKAYNGDKLVFVKNMPIKYIEPIEINVSVKPESYKNPEYWKIEFNLQNKCLKTDVKGKLKINTPEQIKQLVKDIDFEIKAGQTNKLTINVPDSILKTKVLSLNGEIILDSGEILPVQQDINLESCIYAEKQPVIDGKLDKGEWNEAAAIDLSRGTYVYLDGNQYGGAEDLTGRIYTAWDKDYFYLAADITDDVYAQDNMYGGVFWRSDGIQIAFAKYRGISAVSQFDIAKINGEDRITIERTPDASLMGELSKDKYVLKISNEGKSTIYEAKIPWSVIFPDGYTAEKNGELAITLLVNDNDGSVREGFLEFGSGMGWGGANTSQYNSFYMLGKSLIENLK